jgi:putative transposase
VYLLLHQQCRRLRVVFGDSAYGRLGLPEWVRTTLRLDSANRFATRVRERFRRFAEALDRGAHFLLDRPAASPRKDYERRTDTSEAMIYIAMISLTCPRLA